MGALGSAIGGAIGGAIGTALLPGVGTMAGKAVGSAVGGNVGNKKKEKQGGMGSGISSTSANLIGAGLGLGQMVAGKIKQKKADAMLPGMEDPEQRMLQRQFARQKRALQTGTANSASRGALRQMMQSGIKEGFKYGAGTRGLNEMNKMYMQGLLGLNQQGVEEAGKYAGMEAEMTNTMAQRKLELGMEKYDREQARSAQLLTDGKRNLGSSLSRMVNNDIGSSILNKKVASNIAKGGVNAKK